MNRLDKTESLIIVATVWGASWLTAALLVNWAEAIGISVWFVLLGFAAVGSINKRRQKKAQTSN
jgi:hypothetical protein